MNDYEKVKQEINLAAFIIDGYGWELDLKDSSKVDLENIKAIDAKESNRNFNFILRKGGEDNGRKSKEKLGVTLTSQGRWLYSDNRPDEGEDHGKGSIIDWVMTHDDEITSPKKALEYLLTGKKEQSVTLPSSSQVKNEQKRRNKIETHIETKTLPVTYNKYLQTKRNIAKSVMLSSRFYGCVREDKKKNALFVHKDSNGNVTGYALKNDGYSSFSSGGKKAGWTSNFMEKDKELIVCESAIDCLSHYQYSVENKEVFKDISRYLSIEGRLTDLQKELIKIEAKKVKNLVLAFDADRTGADYEEILLNYLEDEELTITREEPPHGMKDWNEIFHRP